MKNVQVRVNGNGPEKNDAHAPAYPHLAACYYHFGYLRLAVGRKAGN